MKRKTIGMVLSVSGILAGILLCLIAVFIWTYRDIPMPEMLARVAAIPLSILLVELSWVAFRLSYQKGDDEQ